LENPSQLLETSVDAVDDHLGIRELVQFVTKPDGAIVFKSPDTQKIGCLRGTNRFFFAQTCSADFGNPFRCIDHLDPRKNYPGWWFGTMEFYDFPYIGKFIIPFDELHHFSEG
jgi:hypothetical protein